MLLCVVRMFMNQTLGLFFYYHYLRLTLGLSKTIVSLVWAFLDQSTAVRYEWYAMFGPLTFDLEKEFFYFSFISKATLRI